MKLSKQETQFLGLVGIIFGFLSGMFVEYTNSLITPGTEFESTAIVIYLITFGIAGTLLFSELS